MRDSTSDPKTLMKRLRSFLAESLDPQTRLNLIVHEIAQNMDAEVCSLYILHPDGMLKLYATKGLNPESIYHAQLRLGQGLVGNIAATSRSLNLVNAQDHPAFTYLPETGEEIYSSFLGVPILRNGRTLGVLVVQNRNQRSYSDDEVEILETIVMVLAEMIASGNLPRLLPFPADHGTRPFSRKYSALNEGIAQGRVILHEPSIAVTTFFHENADAEYQKLSEALTSVHLSIDAMLERRDIARDGEHRDILETYRMFAHDKGWVKKLKEAIHNGLTAEAAVEKVQNDTRSRMMAMTDPYMRERLSDFDDLTNRLLAKLLEHKRKEISFTSDSNHIIVARSMGAAELLDYPREKICGLVLEDGATDSHVVIVARAMEIPVIGQARGVFSLANNGDRIIIDGDEGRVHLRPEREIEKPYEEKASFVANRQRFYQDLRDIPTRTKDNIAISLLMNAGLLVDLPHLEDSGAEGIGLFRTELQFMVASTIPKSQHQEKFYRAVYDAVKDKTVTFRTLDIGGDKILPYLRTKIIEKNPALGWRAIRLTLDRPVLMRMQLRALLKASQGRKLRFMLPMVTEISEIHQTKQLIHHEIAHLTSFGYELPLDIKMGAMIEVPSLLFQLDELMHAVDFISVGSNDLFQFFTATDRNHSHLAERFDPLSPPILRALRTIIHAANRNKVDVTLCGEMAGKPLLAMALIGLGFRNLSMSASSIGAIKSMLLSLDAGILSQHLDHWLDPVSSARTLRPFLLEFAQKHHVILPHPYHYKTDKLMTGHSFLSL